MIVSGGMWPAAVCRAREGLGILGKEEGEGGMEPSRPPTRDERLGQPFLRDLNAREEERDWPSVVRNVQSK